MKNKIYILNLFLFISSLSLGQNIPKDFIELSTNVSSRGEYNQSYNLASETYYNYNNENNSFEEGTKVIFEYYDGKCTAKDKEDVETYEFYNRKISKYLISKYNMECIYSYDDEDKLIQFSIDQNTSASKIISSYEGNNIVKQELYDIDNLLIQYFEFEYNSNGTLYKHMYYYNSVDNRTEEGYSYLNNKLSNISIKNYSDGSISSTSQEFYEYFDNDKLKNITSSNSKSEFEYDIFENLQTKTRYSYIENVWELISKEEYLYNYDISIENINLPGSIVYTAKAYMTFELAPYQYKYLIPKYENGEIGNFIKQIDWYNWNSNSKTWDKSRKVEYELSGGSLYNEVQEKEYLKTNLFIIMNKQIITYDNKNTVDIYTLLGDNVENENLKAGIYILLITTEKGNITTHKIMIE